MLRNRCRLAVVRARVIHLTCSTQAITSELHPLNQLSQVLYTTKYIRTVPVEIRTPTASVICRIAQTVDVQYLQYLDRAISATTSP